VSIAIDDFGTGYSSLAYLHDLPAGEIKIDRSFIRRLDRDPRDRHVVEAVIRMARALGLTVVAEGVETASQLAVIGEAGCELAQGYLFARPGPPEALLELIDNQGARGLLIPQA
jgi:EAL domain-containing protein (putative c-di-GMP-specific phosphodiesterase class I)